MPGCATQVSIYRNATQTVTQAQDRTWSYPTMPDRLITCDIYLIDFGVFIIHLNTKIS